MIFSTPTVNKSPMSTTHNLSGTEAAKKIKELAEKEKVCFMVSGHKNHYPNAVPMHVNCVDDDGSIWIFSPKDSDHNNAIRKDSMVHLYFANRDSSEYLALFGPAEITTNKNKIEEHWTPAVKAWFTEGKDDPNISLIRVNPEQGHYWDTKHNKMVQLLKIAVGAVVDGCMLLRLGLMVKLIALRLDW